MFLGLSSCQEDTITLETYGELHGTIVDKEGQPLEAVAVTTSPATTITLSDSLGNFQFSQLTPGEYTVIAEKEGFLNTSVRITLQPEQTRQISLSMQVRQPAPSMIQGQLLDALTNRPVASAMVTTSPPTVAVLSDAAGYFTLDSIPANVYTILVRKNGYQPDSVRISLEAGKTSALAMLINPQGSLTLNQPENPQPTHLSADMPVNVDLNWGISNPVEDAALTYEVHLYNAANPADFQKITNLQDTSLAITNLAYGSTYFWQVVALDREGNRHSGELWSFTTMQFPQPSYVYARMWEEQLRIFAADQSLEHQILLTPEDGDFSHPRISPNRRDVAYTKQTPAGPQLFVADIEDKEAIQVSRLPVTGYHNYGEGYCWSPDGSQLLYSHYNKLYRVDKDGSHLQQLATAPEGFHFKSLDWSEAAGQIVVQATTSDIHENRLYLVNPEGGRLQRILHNLEGRIESPSFSVDGKMLLFSHDRSGYQSLNGRQLDADIFLYDLAAGVLVNISENKDEGTNDTRPRFSPNGAYIIFENASNEEGAPISLWQMDLQGSSRNLMLEDACMPDWR
jgi:TolB protein